MFTKFNLYKYTCVGEPDHKRVLLHNMLSMHFTNSERYAHVMYPVLMVGFARNRLKKKYSMFAAIEIVYGAWFCVLLVFEYTYGL